jgi:hypothetical protein
MINILKTAPVQWLMPVFLVTQEAEIRRVEVIGQPEHKVSETPF